MSFGVSVDELEKTEDPPFHSSRSVDPQILSEPSVDPPMISSRSVLSTGRLLSAAKKGVVNFLEKETRLEDIDQVCSSD